MKECTDCRKLKPLVDYQKNKLYKDGYSYNCKECRSETFRLYKIKKKYGLSKEQYKELLLAADHCCEICGTRLQSTSYGNHGRARACIDHDHSTGEVRGILCQDCNFAIGLLKDSPTLAKKAARYLGRK